MSQGEDDMVKQFELVQADFMVMIMLADQKDLREGNAGASAECGGKSLSLHAG